MFSQVLGYFIKPAAAVPPATAMTTTATQPQAPEPVITDFPTKVIQYLVANSNLVIALSESKRQIFLFDYTTKEYKYTFMFDQDVSEIKYDNNLYVQFQDQSPIQAFDIYKYQPVALPDTWKKVSQIFFGRTITAHVDREAVENRPLTLTISDRWSFKTLQTISTDCFKIYDVAEKVGKLFVLGIDTNPKVIGAACGFLMLYEGYKEENVKSYKVSFIYDSDKVLPSTLNVEQGMIYNSKWSPTVNCLWDYHTFAPILAKPGAQDSTKLTQVIGSNLVVVDSKTIAVYKVTGEVAIELPAYLQNSTNGMINQSYGTKFVSLNKTIECPTNNPITSLHHFTLLKEQSFTSEYEHNVLAEGYDNGVVRIRDLKDYNVKMELIPPGNMKKVCSIATNYANDKLLVHYGQPSSQGTLALVWDLKLQSPLFAITRDALINRPYDSSQDMVEVDYTGSITVVSEDQALYYKEAMK